MTLNPTNANTRRYFEQTEAEHSFKCDLAYLPLVEELFSSSTTLNGFNMLVGRW